MSAERLKSLVEQGNLINLNIMSDSLGNLLNEIAQMLVEQQRQIVALKKEVADKCSKADYSSLKDQLINDKNMILRSIPNIDVILHDLHKIIDNRSSDIRDQLDQSISTLMISMDTRIAQKVDSFTAELSILQQNFASLNQKMQLNTLPSLQTQKSDVSDLNKRLQKLESDVQSILSSPSEVRRTKRFQESSSHVLNSPSKNASAENTVHRSNLQNSNNDSTISLPNNSHSTEDLNKSTNRSTQSATDRSSNSGSQRSIPFSSSATNSKDLQSANKISGKVYSAASLSSVTLNQNKIIKTNGQDTTSSKNSNNNSKTIVNSTGNNMNDGVNNNTNSNINSNINSNVNTNNQTILPLEQKITQNLSQEIQFNSFSQPNPNSKSEIHINPFEIEELKNGIINLQTMLEEQNNNLILKIDRKSDNTLVERMFEKLRLIITSVKDDLVSLKAQMDKMVDKDEMEKYVSNFHEEMEQTERSALTSKSMRGFANKTPKDEGRRLPMLLTGSHTHEQ